MHYISWQIWQDSMARRRNRKEHIINEPRTSQTQTRQVTRESVHPVVREDRDSCGQLEEFAYPLD